MNKRTDIEVIINNKRYTLRGYESEEYLQKVATYINNKYAEFKKQDFYRSLDTEMRNVLMNINIADDFFKLKKQEQQIEAESDKKSEEIFDLKHEIILLQTKLESAQNELAATKSEYLEEQKKVIRLETELNESRKNR
ncbi:MAG TPA: cell division protein ZapA [Lachnoclostridium phytofermentans]|uniref:Cell division protein ZapA n=1 Tax=Lachnoclostridium phytofermentans TaxID=66219 RepID=A0A3D2X546_9FIRM|nr:cell division protein ZapA [Lachnoclostridium sp.]HCL02259.1 cell division protein ZapA [Lachnoclostridium phytofermentans]